MKFLKNRPDRKNSSLFAEVIEIREKYTDVGENEKFIKGDLFYLNKYDEFDSTLSILW